jgi:hypothetical protein
MSDPYDNPTATRALIAALVDKIKRLRPEILAAVRPLYANPVEAAKGGADELGVPAPPPP